MLIRGQKGEKMGRREIAINIAITQVLSSQPYVLLNLYYSIFKGEKAMI